MAELKRSRVAMPSAGMNTVAPPGLLPDGKGPLVRNFLPHFPGKMVMRGPIDGSVFNKEVVNNTYGIISGLWVHNNKIFVGLFSPNNGERIPPWKAPYLKPKEEGQLTTGSSNAWVLDTETNTASAVSTAATGKQTPSGVGARVENYTYGFGVGIGTSVYGNNNQALEPIRPLLKWTGGVAKPIEFTNSPDSCQYAKNYLNTLFLLGGRSPETSLIWSIIPAETFGNVKAASSTLKFEGDYRSYLSVGGEIRAVNGTIPAGATISSVTLESGPITKVIINKEITSTSVGLVETKFNTKAPEPNTLFFVTPGVAIEDSLTTWKSPTTGLINRLIVGDDDRNDFGVAMAVVNQTLIIFKRKSVWALYGRSPSEFQIRNLTYEFGCIDPWSVCETHYGVYFMSQNGLQYYNGESFSQVDSEIESITVPLATSLAGEKADQSWKEQHGRITVADVGNGYLMMVLAAQKAATLTSAYGEPLSSWVGMMHMETGNWTEISSNTFEGARKIVQAGRTYSYPFCFDGTWMIDLNSISGFNEKVNRDTARQTASIPALLWTDRVPLASPGYTAQLHRIMQDSAFPNAATDNAAVAGWKLGLKDGDGTVIVAGQELPGVGYETKYLRGRRWEFDVFNEAIDVRLEIENGVAGSVQPKNPEIYDATIEFSLARQRRST